MHEDVDAAIEALPPTARKWITHRRYAKVLEEVGDTVAAEEQVAAVVALPFASNTGMFASSAAPSGRILVVTDAAVHIAQNKPLGPVRLASIPFDRISAPPRFDVRRSIEHLGRKISTVIVDEQRGGEVITHRWDIVGEEATLGLIRERLSEQLAAFHHLVHEEEVGHAGQASANASRTSVANELKKLNDLRQEGILTQAEFDAQKARLLTS
ncbi:MAG: SHOCT domain-containing protein [Actinomycetota bacterium]|nr:SHOCT domain-containing protein [Actinomycetota bacterium]